MHGRPQQAQQAQRGLHPQATQRVRRLAAALATRCAGALGCPATARLLLPAVTLGADLGGSRIGGGRRGNGECKAAPPTPAGGGDAGITADEWRAVERLAGLLKKQQQLGPPASSVAAPAAAAEPPPPQPLRRHVVADWFWSGCNLVAGAAALVLLLRG